ncbi:hypothetical protein BDF22DRAFT_743122 [Syncephalis plumigaleata]|nr:hypothetical protein BDF22DRAFT_743122 [Syncephalis plumigaleata]
MSTNYNTSRMAHSTSVATSSYITSDYSNKSSSSASASSYGSSMLATNDHVAFNANLEADLRATCREVESAVNTAAGKGYYVSSNVHDEQSDDDSVYMSDEDVDEEMESEYMDTATLPGHNDNSGNPSADAAAATAAAIASEEPSALAKLAASAVWTMLISRFDLPAPASLESLAHTLHFALEATQLPRVMTHLALFYLHRLLACADRADPVERQRFFEAAAISNKVTGSQFSAYHRLFTVALALADAYLDDHAYAGSAWAQVAGDRHSRLWNRFHMQSLDIINWRLEVPNNDWVRWRSWLGDWWRAVGVIYWSSGSNKSSSAKKASFATTTTTTATTATSTSSASRADGNSTASATLSPARTPMSDSDFSLVHLYPNYGQTTASQGIPSGQPLLTPASSYENISSIKQTTTSSRSSNSGRSAHSYYSTPETPVRGDRNDANAVTHYGYSSTHRRASFANGSNSGSHNMAASASASTAGYMIKGESTMLLPSPQAPQSQPQRYHYSSTTGQLVTMEPHAFSYSSCYRR